jgi:hypothetical protein
MKRRWQPGVLDEVAGAILYVEGERPGLGTAFRASLERTLAFLEENPRLHLSFTAARAAPSCTAPVLL